MRAGAFLLSALTCALALSAGCSKSQQSEGSQDANAPKAGAVAAGCAKDTDCKGDRICERGQCVAPAPSKASAGPVVQAPPLTAPTETMAVPHPDAPKCQSDSACADGHRCNTRYGRCAWPCESDADCVAGMQCIVGSSGGGGTCARKIPSFRCTDKVRCFAGERCCPGFDPTCVPAGHGGCLEALGFDATGAARVRKVSKVVASELGYACDLETNEPCPLGQVCLRSTGGGAWQGTDCAPPGTRGPGWLP
jgi:hypothetical protein